ncbi:hypothetical protein CANCADRAFT_66383 [Tortispora caseinolytica NRRL Y-17796]|uniref:Uncharacterized protein n=1 Tax=Tortispora caseinolytica NRRL Y-17796 TaxID=767744 RepID=A0A1E4TI67_9ASCO|nr:hypothetical protein CANCADRAFT_66383 [Tortispora caseinolytica NRRL Y-17796]
MSNTTVLNHAITSDTQAKVLAALEPGDLQWDQIHPSTSPPIPVVFEESRSQSSPASDTERDRPSSAVERPTLALDDLDFGALRKRSSTLPAINQPTFISDAIQEEPEDIQRIRSRELFTGNGQLESSSRGTSAPVSPQMAPDMDAPYTSDQVSPRYSIEGSANMHQSYLETALASEIDDDLSIGNLSKIDSSSAAASVSDTGTNFNFGTYPPYEASFSTYSNDNFRGPESDASSSTLPRFKPIHPNIEPSSPSQTSRARSSVSPSPIDSAKPSPPSQIFAAPNMSRRSSASTSISARNPLNAGPVRTSMFSIPSREPSRTSLSKYQKKQLMSPLEHTSALSSLLSKQDSHAEDPLEKFRVISGRNNPKALRLKIYRPTGKNSSKYFEVSVVPDATVADIIGYILLSYIEQKQEPELTEAEQNPDAWTLRIVEDDGEPDEDFPALDRSRVIKAFGFDEFALVEATPQQLIENEAISGRSNKQSTKTAKQSNNIRLSGSSKIDSTDQDGEVAILKIYPDLLYDSLSCLKITTSKSTFIRDVMETVCKTKSLDPTRYLFRVIGSRTIVPLERTVRALNGHHDLELISRGLTSDLIVAAQTDNPSAPLSLEFTTADRKFGFDNPSNYVPEGPPSSMAESSKQGDVQEVTSTYVKYNVWRRQQMSFNLRQERVLAIDGEYIHIMPAEDRTALENQKTSSYHVSLLRIYKQSRKIPKNFKLIFQRSRELKRYDFETESAAKTQEIISRINKLVNAYNTYRKRRQSAK